MADVIHTFEGGTSDGAQLTVANSGSGGDSAFATSGVLPATAVWTYSTTGKITGTYGGRIAFGSSTTWGAFNTITSGTQAAARWGFTFNSAPPVSIVIACFVLSNFSTRLLVGVNGTGHLMVQDAAGTTLASSAAVIATNTAYYAELQVDVGTTTSNGTMNCQWYTAAAPGSLLLNYASGATVNGGALNVIRGQLGGQNPVTALDLTFDDVLYRAGTTVPVGAPVNAAVAAATGVPPSTADAVTVGMTIRGS